MFKKKLKKINNFLFLYSFTSEFFDFEDVFLQISKNSPKDSPNIPPFFIQSADDVFQIDFQKAESSIISISAENMENNAETLRDRMLSLNVLQRKG